MNNRKILVASLALAALFAKPAAAEYCREYTERVNIGGQMQGSYGTACMQPDGSWKVVSMGAPAIDPTPVTYVERNVYYPAPTPVIYTRPYYQPSFGLVINSGPRWHHNNHWRGKYWNDRHRGRHNGWDRGRGHGRDRH